MTAMSHPDPQHDPQSVYPSDEGGWNERNGMSRDCTFDDCGACDSATCECSHHTTST